MLTSTQAPFVHWTPSKGTSECHPPEALRLVDGPGAGGGGIEGLLPQHWGRVGGLGRPQQRPVGEGRRPPAGGPPRHHLLQRAEPGLVAVGEEGGVNSV